MPGNLLLLFFLNQALSLKQRKVVSFFAQEEMPRLTQSSQDEPLCRPVSYGYSSKICDSVSLLLVDVMEMLAKFTAGGLKNSRCQVFRSSACLSCGFLLHFENHEADTVESGGKPGIHGKTVQRDDSYMVAPAAQTDRMHNSRCVALLFMKFS